MTGTTATAAPSCPHPNTLPPHPTVTEIAVLDIGGTRARFALAGLAGRRVATLSEPVILPTREQPSVAALWRNLAEQLGRPLPRQLALAWGGPLDDDRLELTNSALAFDRSALAGELGLERLLILNDFVAVGHAIAALGEAQFDHVCGPARRLPADGPISIVGPGTGLGAALLLPDGEGVRMVDTEAGHIGFAPTDPAEDALLAFLRQRYGRVSAERLASGPALAAILEAETGRRREDAELWRAALAGSDPEAVDALSRFCAILGAVAGDIALAQGAKGVVIAGGIGLRLAGRLAGSAFAERFAAKGRFSKRMLGLPVKLLTHPQPGLYGAAAAFARLYPD